MITTELYWMMLEVTLGLFAACLPTLGGFFRPVRKDSRGGDSKPIRACSSDLSKGSEGKDSM